MTFFELVAGSSQASRNGFPFIPGTDSHGSVTDNGSCSSFRSILSSCSKMYSQGNTDVAGRYRPRGADTGPETCENTDKAGFVSFREARDYSSKESSRTAEGMRAVETGKYNEEPDSGAKNAGISLGQCAAGFILQITAQLLGIGIDDLKKVLSMEDAASCHADGISGVDEMALCISQALGLDGEQQHKLAELLRMELESSELPVYENAAEQAGNIEENTGVAVEGEYKAAAGPAETTRATGNIIPVHADTESFIEKLSEHIKKKLDELGVRLAVDKGKTEGETDALTALSTGNPGVREAEPQLRQEKEETGITPASAQMTEETAKKPEGANDDAGLDMQYGDMPQDNTDGLKMPDGKGIQAAVQAAPENPAGENLAAITIEDAGASMQPRDIINQVIEKVKVVLTPEKSEIEMELKPDSLGRVSLKVSAENGLIVARFVADNQQVKQVLEANMQLLKNSLERQGINVQGLSVSVRQESDGYPGSGSEPGENGRIVSAGKVYPGPGIESGMRELTSAFGANSAYLWTYSTIDLTA
ncbi:MAG: flagellar hook-length control protein FliK [Bacillota bacterium]